MRGQVINEGSSEPVTGASVYFNNTSIGTSTDSSGNFEITSSRLVSYELIISSVGYEPLVYKLQVGESFNHSYLFKLKKKESLLREVLTLTDALRKKYLQLFRENFLGMTEEADSSTIENEASIYFTKPGSDKNRFNAYCDSPIIIINKKLGYKIYFQLTEFYYNEAQGIASFYGYTRYEEMGVEKRWITNRRKVYYGSSMHFFRSLIKNSLNEEYYKIFTIKDDSLFKKSDVTNNPKRFYLPVTVAQILKPDSINIGNFLVSSKKEIMVQYNRNTDTKSYLQKHVEVNGATLRGFQSFLTSKAEAFEIDKNGVLLNPLSVVFTGFWMHERAANILPFNYEPEEQK